MVHYPEDESNLRQMLAWIEQPDVNGNEDYDFDDSSTGSSYATTSDSGFSNASHSDTDGSSTDSIIGVFRRNNATPILVEGCEFYFHSNLNYNCNCNGTLENGEERYEEYIEHNKEEDEDNDDNELDNNGNEQDINGNEQDNDDSKQADDEEDNDENAGEEDEKKQAAIKIVRFGEENYDRGQEVFYDVELNDGSETRNTVSIQNIEEGMEVRDHFYHRYYYNLNTARMILLVIVCCAFGSLCLAYVFSAPKK